MQFISRLRLARLRGGGLFASHVKAYPFVIRRSSQEKININRPVFRIGKEVRSVDYCVDNTHVSRSHADIIEKNGEYFIRDNNSLNGTFINGKKIDSSVDVKLEDQFKIVLANEEFIFRFDQERS